jgi:hypothetical protein
MMIRSSKKIRLTDYTKSSNKQIVKETEFSALLNSVYDLSFISKKHMHANPCYDAIFEVLLLPNVYQPHQIWIGKPRARSATSKTASDMVG